MIPTDSVHVIGFKDGYFLYEATLPDRSSAIDFITYNGEEGVHYALLTIEGNCCGRNTHSIVIE